LGIYLSRLSLPDRDLGFIVAAGLGGGALATLLVTVSAAAPRKPILLVLSLLNGAGCLGVTLVSGTAALATLAFLGMLNGMGRDRGAAMAEHEQ